MGHDGEKDPGENLSTVIRARDKLEENSHGHRTLLRTICLAHSAKLKMNCSINTFTDEHSNNANVDDQRVLHSRVQRVTKSIAHLWVNDGPRKSWQ